MVNGVTRDAGLRSRLLPWFPDETRGAELVDQMDGSEKMKVDEEREQSVRQGKGRLRSVQPTRSQLFT